MKTGRKRGLTNKPRTLRKVIVGKGDLDGLVQGIVLPRNTLADNLGIIPKRREN